MHLFSLHMNYDCEWDSTAITYVLESFSSGPGM